MRIPPISTALAAACIAAALACGADAARSPDGATVAIGGDASGTPAPVDSATIADLAARYPVLRAVRAAAPAPRPDAPPAIVAIPASLRDSLPARVLRSVRGEATYYADTFEGRRTASGIPFRQNQMVAAHRGYPFGTVLRVTNLRNDRSVQVRVVDRGPWGARAKARNTIIDLSRRAATQLGYVSAGRAPVKVEVLEWGDGLGGDG